MEGKATLTITSNADDTLDVKLELDPPAKVDEESPLGHHAALVALEAVTEWAAQ